MVGRRFERPPPRSDERAKAHLSAEDRAYQTEQLQRVRNLLEYTRVLTADNMAPALRECATGNIALDALLDDWDTLLEGDKQGAYYIGTKQIAEEL